MIREVEEEVRKRDTGREGLRSATRGNRIFLPLSFIDNVNPT